MAGKKSFCIVESRYYDAIADGLYKGAVAEIENAGAEHTVYHAPGALEIPGLIAMLEKSGEVSFDGYIALGCVIRGETAHFDIVANESARGLMDLTVHKNLAIGNGILTVENMEQAADRADPGRKNKGGEAAKAAILMAGWKEALKI